MKRISTKRKRTTTKRNLIKATILGGVALLACTFGQSALAQTPWFIYGISSNGDLQQFDPTAGKLTATTLQNVSAGTPNPTATSSNNGLAYDGMNNRLFFRGSGTNDWNGSLYVWDRPTGQQRALTGAALPGSSSNAAFYNGNYWYIQDSSNDLVRVTPDFTNPNAPTYTYATFTNFDGGATTDTYGFGDIVIDSTGRMILAAAKNSTRFELFTVDLSSGSPVGNTFIGVAGDNLTNNGIGSNYQLALDPTNTMLYGIRGNGSSSDLFTLSLINANATFVGTVANSTGYIDLASPGRVLTLPSSVSVVPEAGTTALLLATGLFGSGFYVLRTRVRRK